MVSSLPGNEDNVVDHTAVDTGAIVASSIRDLSVGGLPQLDAVTPTVLETVTRDRRVEYAILERDGVIVAASKYVVIDMQIGHRVDEDPIVDIPIARAPLVEARSSRSDCRGG